MNDSQKQPRIFQRNYFVFFCNGNYEFFSGSDKIIHFFITIFLFVLLTSYFEDMAELHYLISWKNLRKLQNLQKMIWYELVLFRLFFFESVTLQIGSWYIWTSSTARVWNLGWHVYLQLDLWYLFLCLVCFWALCSFEPITYF